LSKKYRYNVIYLTFSTTYGIDIEQPHLREIERKRKKIGTTEKQNDFNSKDQYSWILSSKDGILFQIVF